MTTIRAHATHPTSRQQVWASIDHIAAAQNELLGDCRPDTRPTAGQQRRINTALTHIDRALAELREAVNQR